MNTTTIKKEKSMSKMTDIRFRLQIVGGNMRMIKRDVFEYFKKEPDVMQVKDVVLKDFFLLRRLFLPIFQIDVLLI